MKHTVRQAAVILSLLVTLVVNALANALPLNGLTTGAISDQFQVYFVPAGYVFSIWGLIYLGLLAFAIYQVLPSQRENPRLAAVGWWVVLANLANAAWIFLWHYEQFPATLLAMLTLLASLLVIYVKLSTGRTQVSRGEAWAVRVPFSIYLGWITVATTANISDVLYYLTWNGFGIAPEVWFGIIIAVVLALSILMVTTRRDLAYVLVILWALAGIGIKFAGTTVVTLPTWIVFGLMAAVTVVTFLVGRKPLTKAAA